LVVGVADLDILIHQTVAFLVVLAVVVQEHIPLEVQLV
jgi:hypothetical protein